MRDPHLHPEPATPRRRRTARTALLATLALALAACGEAGQSVLDPQGPFAESPDKLFKGVILIALVVFAIVQGLIIYAVVKYRDPGDDSPLPEQVHGNTKLELVWTIIPALILAGIAVPTIKTVFELDDPGPDAITIEVIGHRWWWEYRYPDSGVVTANELVVPVGKTIHLEMTAEEAGGPDNAVIHSFWVPAFAGKQDVVPGRITTLNFQADTLGSFQGQCTEYCGLSHANMRNYTTVVTEEEFEAWTAAQLADPAEPADGSLAATGKELFSTEFDAGELGARACVSCHAIGGEGGIVGPNLTHLMSREMFAGAIFDLYERDQSTAWGNWTDTPDKEALIAWVMDAPSQKAMRDQDGVGMPNLGLDRAQAEAIVEYLLTLE